MLKKNVSIGRFYVIRDHDGYLRVIQLLGENRFGGYDAKKLKTGRTIRIKSAAKLRYEVVLNPENGKYRKVES